jgi:hypothetical protein
MVKAVQSCGLAVGKIVFDGNTVSVVIGGDIGLATQNVIDEPVDPENCSSLEEYRTWRNRQREGGRA